MIRTVQICFRGADFDIQTDSSGMRISYQTLLSKLGCNIEDADVLQLVDGVGGEGVVMCQRGDTIRITHQNVYFVKHMWMRVEGCFVAVEGIVRSMMQRFTSQRPRATAPSSWTRSVGYSTKHILNTGFATRAPYTHWKGISAVSLHESLDQELFSAVGKILKVKFPTFSKIFAKAGRIDVKYNTSISRSDRHFDKQDVCHQVFFSLGSTRDDLCVLEEQIEFIQGYENPTAFDGRFQHWVADFIDSTDRDRISIVCYLVDAPESYQHCKKSMKELNEHLQSL